MQYCIGYGSHICCSRRNGDTWVCDIKNILYHINTLTSVFAELARELRSQFIP